MLLTFFGKQPKATQIPPNVWPSAPVRGHDPPLAASPAVQKVFPPADVTAHPFKTAVEPVVSGFLEKLFELIKNLPLSVPEASDYDALAIFAGNPAEYDNPSLSAHNLWEETLNGLFKSALGWGVERDMDEVIRRGRKGLDGLANFVRHFVVKRGVSIEMFEGKLGHLLSKLEEKRAVILFLKNILLT